MASLREKALAVRAVTQQTESLPFKADGCTLRRTARNSWAIFRRGKYVGEAETIGEAEVLIRADAQARADRLAMAEAAAAERRAEAAAEACARMRAEGLTVRGFDENGLPVV